MSDEDKEKTTEKPSFINKAANIAAYPVSVAVGAFTFVSSVNDKLYDTLKKLGELNEELGKSKTDFKQSTENNRSKIAEKLSDFHKQNTASYNNKLKEMGFTSFWKRFNGIHRDQRVDSAMIGITFATVGLGALLTIANNKGLMEKVNSHDKEKSPETQLAH